MFKILSIGLVIYLVWKFAEGYFNGPTKPPKPPRPENQDRDGFTDYEEVK